MTETPAPENTVDKDLFQKGALIRIQVYGPGFTGKVSDDIMLEKSDLPIEITRATQDRLDRSILKKRQALKSKLLTFIGNNSLPHIIPAFQFIPKERIGKVDEGLRDLQQKDRAIVDEFLIEYPRLCREQQEKYPEFYSPKHYPPVTTLRDRFRFDWSFYHITTPGNGGNGNMQVLPPEVYEREKEKFRTNMEEWRQLLLNTIGQEFKAKMDSIVNQEVKGTMSAKTIGTINKFINQFDDLWDGFIYNNEFKNLIGELREYASTVKKDEINGNQDLMEQIGTKARELSKQLDAIPAINLRRAIDL